MKVGIFTNPIKDSEGNITNKVIDLCLNFGVECFVADNLELPLNVQKLSCKKISDMCDAVIVLGGDGTILHFIREINNYDVPILAINLGNLGFLTEAEISDMDLMIKALSEKKYKIETRSMIKIITENSNFNALNEAVISRGDDYRILNLSIYIDDINIDNYSADGALVSTSTGSTAYSLSTGGPIVSPDVNAFILNAICPHNLYHRPIVVADKHTIMIKCNQSNDARLIIDGRIVNKLKDNDEIVFKKSDETIKLIRINNMNFFNRVKLKLNSWNIS